jgi:phosphoglycolate phosphatase-like HAD superfamily hydrolase
MIYFDFDGTIVDLWPRYYSVFMEAANASNISLEKYQEIKRKLKRDSDVASALGVTLPAHYFDRKKQLLESERFLKMDFLLVKKERLLSFGRANNCMILTRRRKKYMYEKQLAWLGLSSLIEKSVVLHPDWDQSKLEYLRQHASCGDILIGDSKAEWEVSSLKNMSVILVRTGIDNPDCFPDKENCKVLNDISSFMDEISQSV